MKEKLENMTPWAEKLQEITIPDPTGFWQAMETKLDEEMPIKKNKDLKRWILLLICLLLIIGFCNCPNNIKERNSTGKNNLVENPNYTENKKQRVLTSKSGHEANTSLTKETKANSTEINSKQDSGTIGKTNQQSISLSKTENSDENPTLSKKKDEPDFLKHNKQSKTNSQESQRTTIIGQLTSDSKTITSNEKSSTYKQNKKHNRLLANHKKNSLNDNPSNKANYGSFKNSDSQNQERSTGVGLDSAKNNIDSTTNKQIITENTRATKPQKIDSLKKQSSINTIAEKRKSDSSLNKANSKTMKIAFSAGLGLNQFFTVATQQHASYNSDGTSSVLSDYIPVPMVRLYLNKKTFVQLEAQINTPQYTKNLLAKHVIQTDSINNGSGTITVTSQDEVYIKKLFYFNLPLSIHYSPVKNFYVGTGIQFSRLTNGVGLFENNALSGSGSFDSLTYLKLKSLKSDPVYKEIKTYEWRVLFDANYQWKNLVLGLRYNQALSKFIDLQISSSQVTQARNSSFQLYIRYILWKNKKAKELSSK